jgi:putative MATE family efflux protein
MQIRILRRANVGMPSETANQELSLPSVGSRKTLADHVSNVLKPAETPPSQTPTSVPHRGSKFGRDLTVGSIPRHLLAVALPMLLGNLINSGYSIINTIWIGKIVGERAVGATASSFPVVFIFIGLASGATMATTILVSQYYGAKDFDKVKKAVDTSFTIAILLGVLITAAGILFADDILRAMNTPADVFSLASPYLKISMGGFAFMFISFLITSILRGIGDTKTPLAFMGIGVAINAVLDPLLIIGVGPFPRLGLNGAAIASVISSAIALMLGLGYLNHKSHVVAFDPRHMRLDRQIALLILKIGFPSMIQQSLISLGSVFVTTFVNSFGTPAIAAFGAAGRIDGLSFMPAMSLSMASSTIAGQNLGAGHPDRVYRVFRWGVLMTSVIAGFFTLAELIFPHQLLSMFLNDESVIDVGVWYLRIVCLVNVPFAIMFISNGIINGAGRTLVTMLFTLNAVWVFRVPLAAILSRTSLGIIGIWVAIDIGVLVTTAVSLTYFAMGHWKKPLIRGAGRKAKGDGGEILTEPVPGDGEIKVPVV